MEKQGVLDLCKILLFIQRPDGGFDNGYDYNFGRLHKKGEPISPELTALIALVEFYKRFKGNEVKLACQKAAEWIAKNSFKVDKDKWAIPYGPYSSNEVIVYNGTSFAASALGVYLSVFEDEKLELVYHGMNNYLAHVMCEDINIPGKYWFYSDQSRSDLTVLAREKIDYYHQMQQVECHSYAELLFPSVEQHKLIIDASDHVAFLQDKFEIIPYYNTLGDIHLWGYCSCASGFIMASKINAEKSSEYIERAKRIIDWILKYSWNGQYFYPILLNDGVVKDRNFYVRSDAWIFNTICLAIKENVIDESFIEICNNSYCKMESVDFSGIENHASNFRLRTMKKVLGFCVNLINKWRK